MKIENFGRNVTLNPATVYTPESEEEVLEIMNRHRGSRIRCIGRLHSWSQVIDASDVLLDLRRLSTIQCGSKGEQRFVDVGAGCQIKTLLRVLLKEKNWTLPSVGFITEQSIAGAISTGTHGSGRHSLSHYAMRIRIARYDAESGQAIVEEISSGEALRAARCALGCLGIILSVRMQCREAYAIEEQFRHYGDIEEVLAAEEDYPLQQFYLVPWRWSWVAQHRRETSAAPSRLLRLYHWYRFLVFDCGMHLLILGCVRSLGSRRLVQAIFRWILPNCVVSGWRVSGPSSSQLVMEHELFRHVEIELFVPKNHVQAALAWIRDVLLHAADGSPATSSAIPTDGLDSCLAEELENLRGTYCHHYPICVRKIFEDDTLISMASTNGHGHDDRDPSTSETGTPWYSITLTNYETGAARQGFEKVASFLARSMARRFEARPHWGKLCPLPVEELRQRYPQFGTFQSVRDRLDPTRAFLNPWTAQLLLDEPGDARW